MAAPKQPKSPTGKITSREQAEHEFKYKCLVCRQRFRLAERITAWAGRVAIIAFVWLCIRELAGRETYVKAVLTAAADLSADRWFAWIVAAILGGAWYKQKRATRKTVKHYGSRLAELEKQIDKNRTSSGMAEDGDPPQEGQNDDSD